MGRMFSGVGWLERMANVHHSGPIELMILLIILHPSPPALQLTVILNSSLILYIQSVINPLTSISEIYPQIYLLFCINNTLAKTTSILRLDHILQWPPIWHSCFYSCTPILQSSHRKQTGLLKVHIAPVDTLPPAL